MIKGICLFVGGMLTSTAGVKALTSKPAKTVYTYVTAAALRAKDCAMETATKLREEAGDVLADARALNEKRAEEEAKACAEAVIADETCASCEGTDAQ